MSKIKLVLCLSLLLLVLSGCTLDFGKQTVDDKTNGGVFKSTDHGLTWAQKVAVPSTNGQLLTIAGQRIYTMTMDPSDNKALYIGLFDKGILYSYDAAESWTAVRSKTMSNISIIDYAIDPKNKCQMYASVGSKLMKTSDCGRTWQIAYTDPNPNAIVRSIVVDYYNPARVMFGTDSGNLILSQDYGLSWQNIQIFKKDIRKIVLNTTDSRIILIGMANGSVHRSTDGGVSWSELSDKFKRFKGDKSLRDLIAIPSQPNSFLLAMKYGILKTANNGDDWTEIKLLTPKQPVIINSLAVNYKNPALIYYVTDQTFYRTQDGGENWTTTQIPTTRRAWKILTDPLQDGLIYLAVRE